MSQIHVTLRSKPLRNNKLSLYLDFYPPVYDPVRKIKTRREFLQLHIYESPTTSHEFEINQITLLKADKIRLERELQFLRNEFGILDKSTQKMDFLEYFRSRIHEHSDSDSNVGNWKSALEHLKIYSFGKCQFKDVTEEFCKGFQEFLKTARSIRNDKKLSVNTQLSYYAKLKACLKDAVRDKLLAEDPSFRIKGIKSSDSSREYLLLSELKAAFNTPFPENEHLKKAALFSALTGLRWSDIEKLIWAEIAEDPETNSITIRYRQKKTKGFEYLPISRESRNLLGERRDPLDKVFPRLRYSDKVSSDLKLWLQRAGIYKHITFHCFRHTYATLQLSLGTDIYTVSKTLGHKFLKTTEIYAKVVDSKKVDAANRISLL
ncbi:tyrosine-type recombinase/integrase [Algoriphagus pacificus]|uniref:Site-specific integrase n=1 Tax=Algoriphagus pacificus TaxID=2811234 RepID=A0ABS3CIE6_9BACT|nr:site-specific integrase [Algoriphagus pacificus]MBN7816867.1 site-specific integrase [Algoriphagus pacificus]